MKTGHRQYGESHVAVHQLLELCLPQLVGFQSAAAVGQQVEHSRGTRSPRYSTSQFYITTPFRMCPHIVCTAVCADESNVSNETANSPRPVPKSCLALNSKLRRCGPCFIDQGHLVGSCQYNNNAAPRILQTAVGNHCIDYQGRGFDNRILPVSPSQLNINIWRLISKASGLLLQAARADPYVREMMSARQSTTHKRDHPRAPTGR